MKKERFIEEIEEFVQKYYKVYKNRARGWGELKKLTEFEILLDDVLENCKLDIIDRANLDRISTKISDMLQYDKIIFYYSSFFYFSQRIVHKNYEDLGKIIYQINIQINIMKIQIKHSMVTGCSEDDYFFQGRGRELVRALEILCEMEVQAEVDYNAILYMTLNYEQSLLEYIKTEKKTYIESAYELVERCMKLVRLFCERNEKLQKILKNNIKLKMFIYSVYNEYRTLVRKESGYDWTSHVTQIENSNNIINNVWAARNIYDLDTKYFEKYFDRHLNNSEQFYHELYEDSKIIYLRCYLRWLKVKEDNELPLLKLPSLSEKDDKSWFKITSYINGYAESASVNISSNEIEVVHSYNDEVLREKIANIIINIDRHTVNRECKKPHTSLEIADMEIPIRTSDGETYYICIPVKSGVEITSKVKEEIAYQIIRPFTYFGNKAIVIFISAKEATESFYNYVKRAKANLNLDIYVIAGEALVRLLKYNNQL